MSLIILSSLLTIGLIAYAFDAFTTSPSDNDAEPEPEPEVQITEGADGRLDIHLTQGDDSYEGSATGEDIFAGAGNDTVNGNDGADNITLGDGDDTATGGNGKDHIYGNDGSDTLNGGAWNDYVDGGDGDDLISSDDLFDALQEINPNVDIRAYYDQNSAMTPQQMAYLSRSDVTDAGNDYLRGGEGNDVITDTIGSDILFGGAGDDAILAYDRSGTDTPDQIYGGEGNDDIFVDDGDVVWGGTGIDSYEIAATEEDDAAVEIKDYQRGEDLTILVNTADGSAPSLTYQVIDGRMHISTDQQLLAILQAKNTPFGPGDITTLPASVTVRGF